MQQAWRLAFAGAILMFGAAAPREAASLSGAQLASTQDGPHAERISNSLAIIKVRKDGQTVDCSGVFFSGRMVITAGHCLLDGNLNEVKPSDISVSKCLDARSGDCVWIDAMGFEVHALFKRRAELAGTQERQAAKAEKFEIKRFRQYPNDIAMIMLADLAPNVSFVPLAAEPPREGETHHHYGAGRTLTDNAGTMRYAAFNLARKSKSDGNPDSQYLLVATNQVGSCPGDSGGPLFVARDNQVWIAGIGVAMENSPNSLCADLTVSATDFSRQRDWIYVTASDLQRQYSGFPPTRSILSSVGIGN